MLVMFILTSDLIPRAICVICDPFIALNLLCRGRIVATVNRNYYGNLIILVPPPNVARTPVIKNYVRFGLFFNIEIYTQCALRLSVNKCFKTEIQLSKGIYKHIT